MITLVHQPLAQRILRAALAAPRPPQQLLLFGPPGTGKRDAARETAWSLIDPDASHGRGEASLDLTTVAVTGHAIRLPDIDPALADLAARPLVGARRVVIVHEAERLLGDTAARMLKLLEEPPAHSHVILVTDRVGDLIPTIRSRCLPVPFRTPGWRAVAEELRSRGVEPAEADASARADGPIALSVTPFERGMRTLGAELGLRALRGEPAARAVRATAAVMEQMAAGQESPELRALRAEAEALRGKRGGKTAERKVDEQAKRERRRLKTDGWRHVLDGAAVIVADALALTLGAEGVVRRRDRLDDLRAVARPERAAFFERALEEIQLTRSELPLNPTLDLAMEGLLGRVNAARSGHAGRLIPPGREGP